jgi:hypothetical protein
MKRESPKKVMEFQRLVSRRKKIGWNVLLLDMFIQDLGFGERFGPRNRASYLNAEWPGVCW